MNKPLKISIMLLSILVSGSLVGADTELKSSVVDASHRNEVDFSQVENVFIVTIDGLRNSEGMGDSTHQYIPRIWNDLKPLGTIYNNFFNLGRTATTAGHAAITSGVTQTIINNSRSGDSGQFIQEEPSIFQYYRFQQDIPQDKTWIVNGKGALIQGSGISMNPFFGDSYSPHVVYTSKQIDDQVWDDIQSIMDIYHPSFVLINLKDVVMWSSKNGQFVKRPFLNTIVLRIPQETDIPGMNVV